jgi:TatD DNase family protein
MRSLVDIGVNLTHKQFDQDRDKVIESARKAGVCQLITTGTSLAGSKAGIALAKRHPGVVWATAGCHPHEALRHDSEHAILELRALANQTEVMAVGECGLDYERNFSSPEVQRRVFASQIRNMLGLNKPLFLHERGAADDFLAELDKYRRQDGTYPFRAVVHCFTSNVGTLEQYVSRGLFIGITGWICDDRRGRDLQKDVKRIPIDRLMVETDAPFLMPPGLIQLRDTFRSDSVGYHATRNEPRHLPSVIRRLAKCLGWDELALGAKTAATARKFFGLPDV